MNIELAILVLSTVASFFVGLLVFTKNPRSRLNQVYLALASCLTLYPIFNYFSIHRTDRLVYIRIVIALSLMAVYFLYLLACILVNEVNKRAQIALATLTASIVGLIFTPLVFSGLTNSDNPVPTTGPLAPVFFVSFLLLSGLAVLKIATKLGSASAQQRSQLQLIAIGMFPIFALSMVTSFIMAIIFNNTSLVFLSPLYGTFFVTMVGYAIIKHKLFDIRFFVVRALVYVFTVLSIGVFYVAVIYTIGTLFLDVSNVTYLQRGFFGLLALIIGVTYSPIIKFFNNYTSRVFFRDAYDTQQVLDEIGKIIVGNIDLHKIEKTSLEVLNQALKTSYLGFVLKAKSGIAAQDFLGSQPDFDEDSLRKSLQSVGKKELVYDEIQQTSSEKAATLRKNDISLIVPLITKSETIGYLVSGPKKSGNIFNQQDRSMLNIVANELAVALQNAQRFEEIQAFNITLQEKVDEATKELKKTNKKLVELDEAKDEFISMASHQLRTPLTSIKGYLSMLMEGDLGKVSKQQDQALKEAFTSSQRMVFLISDFLNVSRIKTGKFVIEPKEINLSDMVSEQLVQLREMAEAKELKMVYEPPADFPAVKLDENKMHQVMMNMIDNAIYYTPNKGTITIQLYVDGKDVVFKVVDTGIGVPKAEQHKLFTKFFRAGNARKTRPDGTGLGLFMAQKVVVAQGGSIIFESEEGKGSTFGFRFALKDIKA